MDKEEQILKDIQECLYRLIGRALWFLMIVSKVSIPPFLTYSV